MLRDRGFLADLVVRDRVVVFSAAANRGRNTVPTLTDDMKQAITEIHLCYRATVTPEGRPNLSPKGSLRIWDDDHVVFADIASPRTVGNVAANPYVEINIVNPFSRRGFRFKGRAEVLRDGEEFITIARELREQHGSAFPVNGVVKVRVEAARPVLSPAYTCDPSANEADIRRRWLAFYGVKPIGGKATTNERGYRLGILFLVR